MFKSKINLISLNISSFVVNNYSLKEDFMKLNRKQLRVLISEEVEVMSELQEFSTSKGGTKLIQNGAKIVSAANGIRELGDNQTGKMRKALMEISEFVGKLGRSLSEINNLSEAEEENNLPTISELKRVHKAIKMIS
jgi:hypothetical protein